MGAPLHAGALGLAAWVASGHPAWLLIGTSGPVWWLLRDRERGRFRRSSASLLAIGVGVALLGHWSLDRLARNWPEKAERTESRAEVRLQDALDEVLRAVEGGAGRVADTWSRGSVPGETGSLTGLRASGVDALAVFGPSGELLAWDGSHQGPIPVSVRNGAARWIYEEGALFGYLYFTQRLPDDEGVAIAAALIRSELPPPLTPPRDDFRSRFARETGTAIEVTRAERVVGERVFDLRLGDEVLLSVSLLPPSEAQARERAELRWMRLVTLLLAGGWLLAIVGSRQEAADIAVGGVSLLAGLVVLPLGRITGLENLFSPANLLVAGPVAITLGDLLALGLAGVFLLGLRRRVPGPSRLSAPVASLIGAAVAGGLLLVLGLGASRDFLASGELGWIAFQAAAAVLGFAAMSATLSHLGPLSTQSSGRRGSLVASLTGALSLASGWILLAGRVPADPSAGLVLLWALPLWGVWSSTIAPDRVERTETWRGDLWRTFLLALLAATAVLPWAWNLRVHARMEVAGERVDRLGTRPDPFLQFLLRRVGEEAIALAAEGREPVEVLYGAWTSSGLAREGVPLWITYWSSDGTAREELQIGVSGPRPPLRQDLISEARNREEPIVSRFDLAETHYVVVAPVARGGLVSAILPPRRMLSGESPLGPLFSPARGPPDPLVLIPLLPGEAPGSTEGIEWDRTDEGWLGHQYLVYPDDLYRAHYVVEMPGWLLLLARGTLLVLLDLVVVGITWSAGRALAAGGPFRLARWSGVLSSFRGRVTLTLFAFFLGPSILFGTLAYRTLSSASARTAEALAGRAVDDAASWYVELDGAMDALARRVGSDLLLYENGDLVGGSYPELLDLGLYQGWIPPAVHTQMRADEQVNATAIADLGGWEYVVAYHRMAGGRTLAAPAPLQAGATALRQRDVADLLGFSVLMGAILSTLLSLFVGRALSRPIETLRVGSERVGAGNMSVRLPSDRTDEFGAVFEAFNRMVERLDHARRALQRTGRRTRAIVEEVATGVVALDSRGVVKLANAHAESLIGAPLRPNEPLPRGEPTDGREVLADWVDGYLTEGVPEAGTEVPFGDRRIRLRARRISRRGPPGGVVLTLEDVTDELRTERILAWGQMAQQVAHEVKNPLTPIKLGVQHIRRAWDDERGDYEEILGRNVKAILEEIDRLASIASSFSRFAAPSRAGVAPLEPVSIPGVVQEVLELYRAAEGPVSFEYLGGESLPPVRARAGELKEVLVNLLENARSALPVRGSVVVRATPTEGGVELEVSDDGTGIPPELLAKVFEPHFSARSGGTGLGLAIVRRLVHSWGGSIALDSRPGAGTTVRIHLGAWSNPPSHVAGAGAGGGDESDRGV